MYSAYALGAVLCTDDLPKPGLAKPAMSQAKRLEAQSMYHMVWQVGFSLLLSHFSCLLAPGSCSKCNDSKVQVLLCCMVRHMITPYSVCIDRERPKCRCTLSSVPK